MTEHAPIDGDSSATMVPLRRQYMQIKARFPDAILFFRLGDFYETFERDAEITAWLRDHGQTDRSMVFQGLKARAEDMAVILDAKTARVIGIAPFKPWD